MKICFVSYEIAPTTKGGAGTLVANAIHYLTKQGKEVVLLLDISLQKYVRFQWHDRLYFPNAHLIRSYCVEELLRGIPYSREAFLSEHQWRSYRFEYALRQVVALEEPDIVEFFDYAGPAYYSLIAKLVFQRYRENTLSIRWHNPLRPIHEQEPLFPPAGFPNMTAYISYAMEARSLQLAERVLFPSLGNREWAQKYYGFSLFGETCVSPPEVKEGFCTTSEKGSKDTVLFLGYLDYKKGAHIFLNAALLLLRKHPNVRFLLVGGDFRKGPHGFSSFTDFFLLRIPSQYRSHFEFKGHLSRQEISALLDRVIFAVLPTYTESFGYVAHELYKAGIPLIMRNIFAFAEYFHHGRNALLFDGSVDDLVHQMENLIEDEVLRNRLTKPYEVLPEPFGKVYDHRVINSWLESKSPSEKPLSLLVLVLLEKETPETYLPKIANLRASSEDKVWLLSPHPNQTVPLFFLGKLYWVYDENGEALPIERWRSFDLMLILSEDDFVDFSFIKIARDVLSRHPQISYVACWRKVQDRPDTFPIDLTSEILPFQLERIPTRIVFRTPAGKHFFDLFDERFGPLAEIRYLWELEEKTGPGVTVPETYLVPRSSTLFSDAFFLPYLHLLLLNTSFARRAKIAEYLIALSAERQFPALDAFASSSTQISEHEQAYLRLAEIDLKLLLKKLSAPPLGWILSTRRNFRTLKRRYLSDTLEVIATGKRNPLAKGAEVWFKLIDWEGRIIPATQFNHAQGWEIRNGLWFSNGSKSSGTLQWQGTPSAPMEIVFASHPWSGIVRFKWKGKWRETDLFDPNGKEVRIKLE